MNTYYIDNLLTALTYLVCGFALFLLGKFVYQLFHRDIKINYELVENDNLAFAVAHTGYFIGLLFAIGGVMTGESYGLLLDVLYIAGYGVASVILLNVSVLINDKLILRRFSVKKEIIDDKNVGTGVLEGAISIATGMVIMGSVYGEGNWLTLLGYWVLGQSILLLTIFIYDKITPFSIHEHIEKDNVAVGIGAAGALIAIGNLIRFSLMHDFDSWIIAVENIFIDVGIGLLLLPVARTVADKLFLPGQNLTDEIINQENPNNGAAIIEAFSYIGASVLLTWSL